MLVQTGGVCSSLLGLEAVINFMAENLAAGCAGLQKLCKGKAACPHASKFDVKDVHGTMLSNLVSFPPWLSEVCVSPQWLNFPC